MALSFQKYTLSKIMQETADTRTFCFSVPAGTQFNFKPGQFATFRFTTPDGKPMLDEAGKPLVRSYSISSSPIDTGKFCVTIKLVGGFTHRIFVLEEGDTLEAMGPLGSFCINEPEMKDVVMIAGGSGVTPFASMLSYYAAKPSGINLTLIYSGRTEKDFILYKQLKAAAGGSNKVIFTVTRPEESAGWQGKTGRIDANMVKGACGGNLAGKHFFICGPKEMVGAMQELLRSLNVDEKHIIVEKWS